MEHGKAILTARELVIEARNWWETKGRHRVRKEANIQEVGRKVAFSKSAPMIRVQGDMVPVLTNGILLGLPWDRLQKREMLRICQIYRAEQYPDAILQEDRRTDFMEPLLDPEGVDPRGPKTGPEDFEEDDETPFQASE